MSDKQPRLRRVDKTPGPYPLGVFPKECPYQLGRVVVYLLATRPSATIEGADWEQIFARMVNARWKPSNVGLDDVVLEKTAWGAKTVKADSPAEAKRVRLISGRNSPKYSFGEVQEAEATDNQKGEMVLKIWNARVSEIRAKYENVRTVVLLKSEDLLELSMFEIETVLYPPDMFRWEKNSKGNLEGFAVANGEHRFTWQPHGSQFTIIESVPEKRLTIRVRRPELLPMGDVLRTIGFANDWVEIVSLPE